MTSAKSPNLLSVPVSSNRSFDLRHEVLPYFTNPWHFHPELELNFVVKGTGTRLVGQHAARFSDGEIVLLGRNLPHYWKSEPAFYERETLLHSEAIVARFLESFVGESFLDLPEMTAIKSLFVRARDGLLLQEPLRSYVALQMDRLRSAERSKQLLILLDVLQEIAYSDAVEVISPDFAVMNLSDRQNKRFNKVVAYLMENFSQEIVLKDVAELANMHEAAFCRYFKAQSGKTLTRYVTELRIAFACHLLVHSEESVTQICYQAGYENVSHFISVFGKLRGVTPYEFRKRMSAT